MKMALNNDWLRCKAALETAVRINWTRTEAWMAANEEFAIQALSTLYTPTMGELLLADLIEKYVGLYADTRLPNPADDTDDYWRWLHMNCYRLSERLHAMGDGVNTFSWLRREYLRQHGRLVK